MLKRASDNGKNYIDATLTVDGEAFFNSQVESGKITKVSPRTYAKLNNTTPSKLAQNLGYDNITQMSNEHVFYRINPEAVTASYSSNEQTKQVLDNIRRFTESTPSDATT